MDKKIRKLIEDLKRLGRYEIAEEIGKIYKLSVLEYSKSIHSYIPTATFEPALEKAFRTELSRLDYDASKIDGIMNSLKTHRVLQTGPHTTPSFGPRMLCQQWQSTLGISPEDFYLIGMYSGVPFSSDFLPGHLVFHQDNPVSQLLLDDLDMADKFIDIFEANEKKLSLIPSKIQDDLVYRSELTIKTREVISLLTPELKKYFNISSLKENSYTKWAMQANLLLLSDALDKKNVVCLDINEVVTNYIFNIITKDNHIIYKILFDPQAREKFVSNFKDVNIFSIPYMSGKYPSQEGLRIESNFLIGKHTKIELRPDLVIDALINKRLCCGTLLTFTILNFINGFKCLGGFRQAVYLPQFKKQWLKSGLLDEYNFENVPTCNITTGFLKGSNQCNIRPLDVVLGKKFDPDPMLSVGEFILSVSDKFLL